MTSSMTPELAIERLTALGPDLRVMETWGERAVFVNPGGRLPKGVYFATLKEKDGPNDRASRLDRDGVWRLNLGVPPSVYETRFGPRPARPPKGGTVGTGHDFAELDTPIPHPVYGWMGWIAVLCPTETTFGALRQEIGAAHDKARSAAMKRAAAAAG